MSNDFYGQQLREYKLKERMEKVLKLVKAKLVKEKVFNPDPTCKCLNCELARAVRDVEE